MIKGIFYEQKAMETGTMGTTQVSKDTHALHYWVSENEDGQMNIYYLKPDGEPTNIVVENIPMEEFKKRFKDCSNTVHKCSFKKKSEEEIKAEKVDKKIREGEKHLEKKEYNAASFEYGQALKDDEKNLKANFGKGKAHVALGEPEKAKEHFDNMAGNEELYDEDHKHLFNELGIELRKSSMFEDALRNYQKAMEIDADDEALYYNTARAFKEWGKKDEALESIRKALELRPNFDEALVFLKSLEK
ncbi:MAG: hypothetical protein IEMM0002_0098 [bacterium]|nr:MAG: hypothetical protein IEMM0002_0098 [bacterium]